MKKEEDIIRQSGRALVRVATPYHKGTGIYLSNSGLIVTSASIVYNHPVVMIWSEEIPRCTVEVWMVDTLHDLAFLPAPEQLSPHGIKVREDEVNTGESVIATGYPPGSMLAVESGEILDRTELESIEYYRHNAILPSGSTGGPLLDRTGRLVGMNSFDLMDDEEMVRALPSQYILEVLSEYRQSNGTYAVRCTSCKKLQFHHLSEDGICANCGQELTFPNEWSEYQPLGMAKTIEEMLKELGFNAALSRRGPDNWQISKGSASIHISYHEKTGMVVGDSMLCAVGEETADSLYEFLLRENHSLQHLTFSVKNGRVILSLLIYDRYFTVDTGTRLFDYLFTKSDEYDDTLVDEYGAHWLK